MVLLGRSHTKPGSLLKDDGNIGVKVGKVLGKYNMAKNFLLTTTDTSFSYRRDQESMARQAGLDGIYVIRTNMAAARMAADDALRTYKS